MKINTIVSPRKYIPLAVLFFLLCVLQYVPAKDSFLYDSGYQEPEIIEDFQYTLDSLIHQYGLPGATATFVLPDGTKHDFASGFSDLESGVHMTIRSRMLAASIGKTFVGATLTTLSQEGHVNLDAPLWGYLGDRPWFSRLPNNKQITLRHLLTHSSGLPDHVYQEKFAADLSRRWKQNTNLFSPEELIQYILDSPPLFEAGKGWAYSDTNYILLGLVIEGITGKSVFDIISEKFLVPLKLEMTGPSNSRYIENLSAGYMAENNTFGLPSKTTTSQGELFWHPGFEWTGGGFVSNSADLAFWGWTLYGGKAMQEPYLCELLKAVPISHESDAIQYGAGTAIYRNSPLGDVYGHNGWIPGYCSSLRYYAGYGIAVAFQVNTEIGIMDTTRPVMKEMEVCLARIVISHLNSIENEWNSKGE